MQLRRNAELPVIYEKESRYFEPLTWRLIERDVKPQVKEYNPLMAPIYKVKEGFWFNIPDRKGITILEMMLLDQTLKFESMEEIAKGGIHTLEDIEEAWRNILYPVRQERVIRQFVETIMRKDSSLANYEVMFGPDHYHKVAMKFF